MPDAVKPARFDNALTIATSVFSTLAFIIIARELGVDALGSVALFLSLGACLSLSFDLTSCWRDGGGTRIVLGIHLTFLGIGCTMSFVGLAGVLSPWLVPLGLYVAYHGASSAAVVLSKPSAAPWATLVDAIVRLAIVAFAVSEIDMVTQTWLAAAFMLGGVSGLAISAVRDNRLSGVSESTSAGIHYGALAFAALIGLAAWSDKLLVFVLGDQISLGGYFAVQRSVFFIGAAASIIAGMVKTRMHSLDDASRLRLVTLMERYASLCVLPMAAFYAVFAHPIVVIFFGHLFSGYGGIVYPLAVAGFFATLAAPSVVWQSTTMRWRWLVLSAGLALSVQFAAACAILMFSNADAAIVVAVACSASSIAFYVLSRVGPARAGARFHPHIPRQVASALGMATILRCASFEMQPINFSGLVLLALVGVLVYGLLLYLFGEFMEGEWGEFKRLRGI